MIEIEFSTAVFLVTALPLFVILLLWVFSNFKKPHPKPVGRPHAEQIWACAICTHVYIDTQNHDMSQCPLCGSYNKREDKDLSEKKSGKPN